MGRVYNALQRADRLTTAAEPAGHQVRPILAQPALRLKERASTSPDHRFRESAAPVASPSEFDFNEAIALSEAAAAKQLRKAASPVPATTVDSPGAAETFVEPHMVRNVSDLSIGHHMAALRGEDRLACERYRMLGARLLNPGERRKLKTILVTSAEEGEGKSTIAANLAWSIAKPSERRVLLLDANPNSSASLSRLLGVNTVRGWIGVAESRCQLADAAVRLNPNGLYLLMQGSIETVRDGSRAVDPLTSIVFERLLTRLERDFDFIIIDSPPILESGGAQRLASLVDGTVFVVRTGQAHHSAVTEGLKLVPPDRQLGLVLNESEIADEITHGRSKKATARH